MEAKYLPTLQDLAYENWLNEESKQHEHAWYGLDGGAFDMETYYWIMQQLAKTNPTSTPSSG